MDLDPPSICIIETAKRMNASFRLMDENEATALRASIIRQYTSLPGEVIWQNLVDSVSVHNAEGWRMIDTFIQETSFIVFFDAIEDRTMIAFEEGSKLVPILAECPGFEFYITDEHGRYLVCFNHHDFFIGVGNAKDNKVFTRAE